MHCSHCGAQLEPNANFCVHCGGRIEHPESAATTEGPLTPAPSTDGATGQPINTPVSSESVPLKQYFQFILENLKSPASHSRNATKNEKIFGLITIGIYALIFSLISYLTYRAFASVIGAFTMDMFRVLYRNSFVDFFLKPFVFTLIGMAVLIAVMYFGCKWMKSQAHYWDVVGRFGAFLIVPTAILLVSFLFSLISIKFGMLIMILALFSTGAAVNFTIDSFRPEEKEGLDSFYTVIITIAITGLIVYVLGLLF